MRRSRYLLSLFAAAAAPSLASADLDSLGPALGLDAVSAVPEPPVLALLAAGLALGLARGRGGVRRPVRRRRG